MYCEGCCDWLVNVGKCFSDVLAFYRFQLLPVGPTLITYTYCIILFVLDSAEDVKRKIKKAFCPPEVVDKNPIMDYAKNIIFGYYGNMTVNSAEVGRYVIFFVFLALCRRNFYVYFCVVCGLRESKCMSMSSVTSY